MDGGKSYEKFQEKGNKILEMINKLKPRVMKRISISEDDIEIINNDLLKTNKRVKKLLESTRRFSKKSRN